MARTKSIGIRKILTRLLPRRRLERLAEEAGLTKRKRKVQVHALFWGAGARLRQRARAQHRRSPSSVRAGHEVPACAVGLL